MLAGLRDRRLAGHRDGLPADVADLELDVDDDGLAGADRVMPRCSKRLEALQLRRQCVDAERQQRRADRPPGRWSGPCATSPVSTLTTVTMTPGSAAAGCVPDGPFDVAVGRLRLREGGCRHRNCPDKANQPNDRNPEHGDADLPTAHSARLPARPVHSTNYRVMNRLPGVYNAPANRPGACVVSLTTPGPAISIPGDDHQN